MQCVSLSQLLKIHERLIVQSGGTDGLRDLGAAQSALAQPQMTFEGKDLYATLEDKASALCFSLIMNHPFMDGNKRVGHAAAEVYLMLNGYELCADVAEAESIILKLAAGELSREELRNWFRARISPLNT